MNCSFCNATITKTDLSCPACGAPVIGDNVIPPPSPYYRETIGKDAPPPPPPPAREPVTIPSIPSTIPIREINSLIQDRSYWAVASLVLGIIGLITIFIPGFCGWLTSIPAIVLGAMSLKSAKRKFAIAGMALGILAIVIGFVIALVFFGIMFTGNLISISIIRLLIWVTRLSSGLLSVTANRIGPPGEDDRSGDRL